MHVVVLWAAAIFGCARGPELSWPAVPARELEQPGAKLLGYDVDRDGRLDYFQRLRGGHKDRLQFGPARGASGWTTVERGADAPRRPLLVLLLDGVAYDRIHSLYERGRFRLFRPPTRIISTFPSLTDVAYDAFFGSGPTPGFEAAYYDRAANRLTDGVSHYLAGENERWVRFVDYRISLVRDALMYLMPQSTYESELRAARQVLDRELAAGRREVVLYFLSTDGLGHMVPVECMEERLAQLDDWIERAVYDWHGELDLLMLADHGNTTASPRRFDVERVLRAGGFRVAESLKRAGDVVVPLFGLLDMARVHAFDDATRDRVVALFRERPEVELLAWREADAVRVWTSAGTARVDARGDGAARRYRATVVDGDPLGLARVLAAMASRRELDGDGFASAEAWLGATERDDFVAAVPRLWDGFFLNSTERPDVMASLGENWFVGSGFFTAVTKLRGSHGGLARRSSEAFVMSSRWELPVTLLISELSDKVREASGWPADARAALGAPAEPARVVKMSDN